MQLLPAVCAKQILAHLKLSDIINLIKVGPIDLQAHYHLRRFYHTVELTTDWIRQEFYITDDNDDMFENMLLILRYAGEYIVNLTVDLSLFCGLERRRKRRHRGISMRSAGCASRLKRLKFIECRNHSIRLLGDYNTQIGSMTFSMKNNDNILWHRDAPVERHPMLGYIQASHLLINVNHCRCSVVHEARLTFEMSRSGQCCMDAYRIDTFEYDFRLL